MGVEDLQQLNVGGDDRNQVALVPALQLGRAEPPQRTEHLVPQKGQQLEGDEMVAGLLRIPQESPHDGKDHHTDKQDSEGKRCVKPQCLQHRVTAEDGDKGGAQMAHESHKDSQEHKPGQGFHQPNQSCHHLEAASFFHAGIHARSPSFP